MDERKQQTHELKIAPQHFQAVVEGVKKAEIRKMDRDFQVGDVLILKEYVSPFADSDTYGYSGREVCCAITHILTGWGLQDGYAMLSFGPCYGTVCAAPTKEGQQ